MKIASTQFNYQYGDQLHYPYSIGCLAAANYAAGRWLPTAVRRESWRDLPDAEVLLCSCYVWNWEITNRYAADFKAKNPEALVVFGGPQVPDNPREFLASAPYVDLCVHGEGEVPLAAILGCFGGGGDVEDLGGLPGISSRMRVGAASLRIDDLTHLPSPYTSGVIEKLTPEAPGVAWIASWETTRGCPYKCTFCDWGSATYTKLRQFPMERLLSEMEWFGLHEVRYIDCCDANFGILPRDQEIAEHLRETVEALGWPKTFRQSWAKNTSRQIIEVARPLKEAGLLTAVGLALESMDPATLNAIERRNVKFSDFSRLTKEFADAGLPTYTELIRGLPGETYASFRAGLKTLVEDTRIGAIYIYNCSILPNAPMADPAYRRTHGIESVRSPIYLAHSLPEPDGVREFEEIVVATKTADREAMVDMHLLSWAVLLFHSLGLVEQVAPVWGRLEFYEHLLAYAKASTGPLHVEWAAAKRFAVRGMSGLGWTHVDPLLGSICWPIEEASWLRLVLEVDAWEADLAQALTGLYPDPARVAAQQCRRYRQPVEGESIAAWAREVMWYGRRSRRFLHE